MTQALRQIRGAVGNAVVWGAAWFGIGLAYLAVLFVVGGPPESGPWRMLFYVAANCGVVGAVAGGAFSAYIRSAYRGRDLRDLSVARFAVGGAAIGCLFAAALTLVARLTVGHGVDVDALTSAGVLGVALGGITAAGTLMLARRAYRRPHGASPAVGQDMRYEYIPQGAAESRAPHGRRVPEPAASRHR